MQQREWRKNLYSIVFPTVKREALQLTSTHIAIVLFEELCAFNEIDIVSVENQWPGH